MTPAEYIQLKAFARQDGALLALLWISASLLYLMGLTNSMLGLAGLLLLFYTPFFVGGRLRVFRDNGRDGVISFRRCYAYTIMVFFYGGILLALAHYLYFAFIDKGFLLGQFSKMIASDEGQQLLKQYGLTQAMSQGLSELASIRPIDYALNMLTFNISMGFVLGIPISLIMQRRESPVNK